MEKVQAPFCPLTDKPPGNKERHTLQNRQKKPKIRTNKEQRVAQAVHRDYETEFTHRVQKTHTDTIWTVLMVRPVYTETDFRLAAKDQNDRKVIFLTK